MSLARPVPRAPTHTVSGAPTHTPTTTSGMTSPPTQTSTLPTPAESMPPSVMPFEPIDWEFLSVTLQCMWSMRGASVADVSMAAHRLWGMFPPGSNPTVAVALFRAATGGVSADVVNAANALLLSPRHFHATPVANIHGPLQNPYPTPLHTPPTTLPRACPHQWQCSPPTHLAPHHDLHLRPLLCRRPRPRPPPAHSHRRLRRPLQRGL